MDKISSPNQIDHASFLRYFLAVQTPDAYPAAVWIPALNAVFDELTESDKRLVAKFLNDGDRLSADDRKAFVELDRRLRTWSLLEALNDELIKFEQTFFCVESADGTCSKCGCPRGIGGPLCAARISSVPETEPADPESAGIDPAPVADPLLGYFKIPSEPGEINGFDYDALIDSTPVIVWRPACEIETDFVDDLLREAETAGVTRLFLIARTEVGPDKLPINPKVALILLPIPPTFGATAQGVIETDEVVYS